MRHIIMAAALLVGAAGADALAQEPETLRLADDFEHQDLAPGGGLFYKKNFEQSAGTVTFQSHTVRDGNGAVELTIRPICPDDASGCSERAEVWERPDVQVGYDSPVWYGFSMKLVEPMPRDDHRYLVAQWKRQIVDGSQAQKSYSPFLAIRLDKGRLVITGDTDSLNVHPRGQGARESGCLAGETPVNHRPQDGQTRVLMAHDADMPVDAWRYVDGCTSDVEVTQHAPGLPAADSGWIDFAFFIQTGPQGDGRIEILANEQWIATVKGHIGHQGPGLGERQYFKFGPYRAAHETEWTVVYDRFRRGPECEDVASAKACRLIALAQR